MRLIYQPQGRAGEYSRYAVNFYNGCSNQCTYCYNRHCSAYKLLGKSDVTLRAGFDNDPLKAYRAFEKDIEQLRSQYRALADGKAPLQPFEVGQFVHNDLFFNFVSDPCLPETIGLNFASINHALCSGVPCTVLTKRADIMTIPSERFAWYNSDLGGSIKKDIPIELLFATNRHLLTIGMSLTGFDEQEPGASSTLERIMTLKHLQRAGFRTWISFEPVIDPERTFDLFSMVYDCADLFRIGLLNGQSRQYYPKDVRLLYDRVETYNSKAGRKPIFWKHTVTELLGVPPYTDYSAK